MGHDVRMQKTGQKIESNHPLYHLKRKVWNLLVDRHPAVIFECKSEADVVEAVMYAQERGLKITVRGGGFHPAGKSVKDEAVLIDLSQMNHTQVDEVSKIATVGAGAKIYEIDELTQEFCLAVPLGMCSNLGVSGLALGGGLGYLRAKYGLTSDNVVGVHLVTGLGELIYVNRFEHPTLFWAIRGAGANFGVVTKFELKLHPVGQQILGIDVVYDYKDVHQILTKVEAYRRNAVDDISFNVVITNIGPSGQGAIPTVRLIGMYIGELSLEVEENIIQPLLTLAEPIADYTEVMPYIEMQKKFDPFVQEGFAIEGISLFFDELNQDAMDILLHEFNHTDIQVTIYLLELHGQLNRISTYESSFTIRDGSYLLIVDAEIGTHPERTSKWIREIYEKLLPYSYNQTSYLNSSHVHEEVFRNSYKCIYNTLVRLKKEYDPNNLFCSEHKLIE
jgi:UDP-N-acetylenolpyruvoylglucosamine reductase